MASLKKKSGGVLLSHLVSKAVPSALEGLTSGFGMGPGVTLPPLPPETVFSYQSPTLTAWPPTSRPPESWKFYSERERYQALGLLVPVA